MAEERLQKILSRAGISSRRRAEQLMLAGEVTVNGEIITELGTKADLARDHVKVSGKLIHAPQRLVYLALNKPDGCVTTLDDPQGRPTVMQYLRGVRERVYPVGRLDYHSEGLLLFTNDGELANRLTSARYHVTKTYLAKVNGVLSPEQEAHFRNGLFVEGRKTAPAGLKLVKYGRNPWYEVKLIEGRKNQIRLMFQQLGVLVERLRRVQVGFLTLGGLPSGKFRTLSDVEISRFKRMVKMEKAPAKGAAKAGAKGAGSARGGSSTGDAAYAAYDGSALVRDWGTVAAGQLPEDLELEALELAELERMELEELAELEAQELQAAGASGQGGQTDDSAEVTRVPEQE